MDHVTLIAALPRDVKSTLTARSDRRGLGHMASYLGVLALSSWGIAAQVPFWGTLVPVQGILIVFLFTLSHECTHYTPFANKRLNDWVGHAVALPLMLPFVWFRYFHLAHHKYTNDPERDPELAGEGRPETWRAYLIYLSGWGYWSGNARTLWGNAFGTIDAPYLPQRQHGAMRREARVLLALYAVLALSLFVSPLALWLWALPALIGQPALRLYLLAEHGHCPPNRNC
ncbi:MAG: fatty acid desaturase [Rhodobacteraceae bacterium]|nr:fatty acid desaturase [Paracoccaceae bacterium]